MASSASTVQHQQYEPQQHQAYQNQQLPSPSQLFPASNSLPPLPPFPSRSFLPPASPHPSLQFSATTPRSSRSLQLPSHDRKPTVARLSPSETSFPPPKDNHDDGMPLTSDFVKKLYKMLGDPSFSQVVSWGPQGDCFVVKDMTEFTKSILPRLFKHSNFASFVRQLNKYDFHKVKNSEDSGYGEQSWTFRHPDFQADKLDALENIKRKVPSQRKHTPASNTNRSAHHGNMASNSSPPSPTSNLDPVSSSVIATLQAQVDSLTRSQQEMACHIRNLESKYEAILGEVVQFQKMSAIQDSLLQDLIQQRLQGKIELATMSRTSPAFNTLGTLIEQDGMPHGAGSTETVVPSTVQSLSGNVGFLSNNANSSSFTALAGRDDLLQRPQFEDGQEFVMPSHPTSTDEPSRISPSHQLVAGTSSVQTHLRGKPMTPGWVVPPRVLLVEDDAVSRRLSSKFLQVYGCLYDVAVDGEAAVDRMNLSKYDLVLMDIMLPKLDGISATSLIRRFDHLTPIISMTSNSNPNEVSTYYSHGMNDILPKPFSKEGLFDMLEKHLMHLKVIEQLAQVPKRIGIPPLADRPFKEALLAGASSSGLTPLHLSSSASSSDDESTSVFPNPLAGMGLSDQHYALLSNLITTDAFDVTAMAPMGSGGTLDLGAGFGQSGPGMFDLVIPNMFDSSARGQKRSLEDPFDLSRDSKRSRFEVLE